MERLCDDCARVRGTETEQNLIGNMEMLWCSGCKERHSEMHFSMLQRLENPGLRVCIGREGFVKICSHCTLSWSQLRTMSRYTEGECGITCGMHFSPSGVHCSRATCRHRADSVVRVRLTEDRRSYLIQFSTTTHIPFDTTGGRKPDYDSVQMAVIKAMDPADECMFTPDRHFEGCEALELFNPSSCDCLGMGVPEPSSDQRGRLMPAAAAGDYNGSAAGPQGRCYGARHGFVCTVGNRLVDIDLIRCRDDANLLILRQRTSIIARGPADPNWEDLLEPTSYLCRADENMRGLTWCRQADCAVTLNNRSAKSLAHVEGYKPARSARH